MADRRPLFGEWLPSSLLTSHSDWRPDWTAARPNWWWYATFESDPTVRRLARDVQESLRQEAPVDPIPLRWLHLSLAEVGYVADVPAAVAHECALAAREALAGMHPVPLTIGRVMAMPGAVVLDVRAPELVEMHHRLLMALSSTLPRPPAQPPFAPHISVAYVRRDCTSEEVFDAAPMRHEELSTGGAASTELTEIALVEVVRNQRHYRWTARHRLRLGSA